MLEHAEVDKQSVKAHMPKGPFPEVPCQTPLLKKMPDFLPCVGYHAGGELTINRAAAQMSTHLTQANGPCWQAWSRHFDLIGLGDDGGSHSV